MSDFELSDDYILVDVSDIKLKDLKEMNWYDLYVFLIVKFVKTANEIRYKKLEKNKKKFNY